MANPHRFPNRPCRNHDAPLAHYQGIPPMARHQAQRGSGRQELGLVEEIARRRPEVDRRVCRNPSCHPRGGGSDTGSQLEGDLHQGKQNPICHGFREFLLHSSPHDQAPLSSCLC